MAPCLESGGPSSERYYAGRWRAGLSRACLCSNIWKKRSGFVVFKELPAPSSSFGLAFGAPSTTFPPEDPPHRNDLEQGGLVA